MDEDREVNADRSPEVSVVVPVYNGATTISEQLAAVMGQESRFSFEVVVVDNDSTDDTAKIVDAIAAVDGRVRRVQAPDRHNLSYVRNTGVRLAAGRYILFCDDDDLVERGWLDALADALTRHRFVASRMQYDRVNPTDVMQGRTLFQSDELGSLFGYVLANGAIGVHREVWEQLGGNDENLGVAGEDFDFAIRAQRDLGVVPKLVTSAVYHYRQRGGARSTWVQARRYGRSHVVLYKRYGVGRIDRADERNRALREWWWVLSRVPLLVNRDRRVRWARCAGMRLGRLSGSLRERVLYL